MPRKVMDCRRFPSESNCSLTIIGEESEVLPEAEAHAVRVHGHAEGPELHEMLKLSLETEEEYDQRTGRTERYGEPLYVT